MRKVFIFVFICITVFFSFYYIFLNFGNNKFSKGIDDILNRYSNYEAEIEVIIKSNKNENKYVMKQIVKECVSKAQIIEPESMSAMIIEKENSTLKITNSLLNVEKCYENQQDLLNNFLFLNVFINDFNENVANVTENDEEIIVEINLEKNLNTYVKYKKLIINKETEAPKELIIKDNTNNIVASIKYNNFKI